MTEHDDEFPYGDIENFTYIGDDHWYMFVGCNEGCPGQDLHNGHHGILQPHYVEDHWCSGFATFTGHNPNKPGWDVITLEPLTLSPSLLCRWSKDQGQTWCGDHGFIREDRWIEA